MENFGSDHPVTNASVTGPWVNLRPEDFEAIGDDMKLERVRDFERVDSGYII
jgi:hypothetical protein